tara:strand:+ start:20049 stop:22277 length:2229 start_codon:yes stop_codon:yes gene_type:complete
MSLPKRNHASKESKLESLPWIEKYRPANLDQVIAHDNKIEVLKKLIDKRQLPHLLFYGQSGSGKCLGKGTLVRMYDGSLKKVEDLKKGELLMGDDSTPRTIISTCNGTENMYKIEQSSGIIYIVNESHIITLKKSIKDKVSWDKPRNAFRISTHKKNGSDYNMRFHVKRNDIKRRGGTREIKNIYDTIEEARQAADKKMDEITKSQEYIDQGDSIDISIKDYIKKSSNWKKYFKGYRTDVEYPEKKLDLDPYFIGIWLGDGTSSKCQVTTTDIEIIDYLEKYSDKKGLKFKLANKNDPNTHVMSTGTNFGGRYRNKITNGLRKYNLLNNKHIPNEYKYNTRKNRLKLLAGLIDSDGYKDIKNNYDIVMKSEKLIDDIEEVCHSLGFKCTKNECIKSCTNATVPNHKDTYYRLYIKSCDLSQIPVLLERKKIKREDYRYDFTLSKIEVTPIGVGEYYGFELDGNGRFLLKDYTVTHNTSSILALARQMYGPNYKRYILELNASDDRGIDMVRNKIPIFAKTKSDDMRLVILDEADAMTDDAQSALRRIMELYIKNCRFCLICNNINKIIPGIQSRCAKMRFGVLDSGAIKAKLSQIIVEEKIEVDEGAIDQLLEIHTDFRQILNTLQCLRSIRFGERITKDDVIDYLGKANHELITKIIETFNCGNFKKSYNFLLNLHRENKVDIIDLVGYLVNYTIERDDIEEITRSKIIDGLAGVEYRMITGSDTEIQLASLVGHMMAHNK